MFPGQVIEGGWVSLTVTVKLQTLVGWYTIPPAGSLAAGGGGAVPVQVTVVVPTGKNEPDAGLQTTD
jgi:hypothetical protein